MTVKLPISVCAAFLAACSSTVLAADISGAIGTTLTIMENSRLVGDVTCTVTGAPCISFGASSLTLDLNSYHVTGLADPRTTCISGPTTFAPPAVEDGIDLNGKTNSTVRGPGVVELFRGPGIFSLNSNGLTITGVTTANNCMSGILVGSGSNHDINNNISIRNGSRNFACGGICLYGGSKSNRVRANRLSGNGYSAQGHNFGIGLENAGTTGNLVEANTVFGNAIGLFLTAGVQGNIIRQNLFAGNPAVQTDVDNPSDAGADIVNLATAGDNAFEGNVCMSSVNAPCAALGVSLTADPNPIPVTGNANVGQTTISWNAPDVQAIEIHIGSPNGPLFTQQSNRGSIQTGVWVSDGLTFYLQDVTGGKPLSADYTLATLTMHLQAGANNARMLYFGREPRLLASGVVMVLTGLGLVLVRRGRLRLGLGGAAFVALILLALPSARAQSRPSPQQTAAVLDQMIAGHKTQQEIAQYVFDNHGCKTCHTVGQNGKLGFTAKGKQTATTFEGCTRLLTDMTVIARMPEDQRSAPQKTKATHFEEFGCTFCHQISPGKLGLTEVGTKLSHLNAGCVDVEKTLAGSQARR